MAYTNSSLVSYTKLSPNHSGQRTHSIDRITPHCVVGQCSVETLGNIFLPVSKQASCNYGIGEDGSTRQEELPDAIRDSVEHFSYDEKYRSFSDTFCHLEDGRASARFVEQVFQVKVTSRPRRRPLLLADES